MATICRRNQKIEYLSCQLVMTYELIYTEQRKIAWVLVLIPISLMAALVSILLSFHNIPDWLLILSILLVIGFSVLLVLFIIKKWLMIKINVEVNDGYFSYRMQKNSPLYSHNEIRVSWEQVINFNAGEINTSSFAVFKIAEPHLRFSLSPLSVKENDKDVFYEFVADVEEKIAAYNAIATEKHLHVITHKSIFESTGARIGALVFLIALVVITLLFAFAGTSTGYNWLRLAWLWIAGTPYFLAVYSYRKKGAKKN